jgi:15-hydroxyprostaglandin dehydrogenase (NAD)
MGKDEGGKGGVVVNMASIAGLRPTATFPVYVATKHAVIGLSRSFGVSTACSNVHVLYWITYAFFLDACITSNV